VARSRKADEEEEVSMGPTSHEVEQAARLMRDFVERTGHRGATPNRRYLWTDAFAVCNLTALWQQTSDDRYRDLALDLVQRVHYTLGRFRDDDARHGFISGLDEVEGSRHPTRGGLRIGKPLPERGPSESIDRELEWERDGQYFHYLTKWMLALDRLSRATGSARLNLWATELLEAAHRGFTAPSSRLVSPHLYWKMSTDLSRPLVSSRGQHDALDGLISAETLSATATTFGSGETAPRLIEAMRDFSRMIEQGGLTTTDPLGLGELLSSACRAARLRPVDSFGARLLPRLLAAALEGLRDYERSRFSDEPAFRRLAFRELGLAIGLSGVRIMERELGTRSDRWAVEARAALEGLRPFVSLGESIREFWAAPERQRVGTWSEHRDINEVMLATSFLPDGYLR
jgi:hypothetical protein